MNVNPHTDLVLKNVFEHNRALGVPFKACFMLVLNLSGHTQASLMQQIDRSQSALSQYLNGYRSQHTQIPASLRRACQNAFGFDPWALESIRASQQANDEEKQ